MEQPDARSLCAGCAAQRTYLPFACPSLLCRAQLSANWRPRTSPVEGEGYFFFQGPSPKTSVQEGMPDFFSGDNIASSEGLPLIGTAAIGLTAVGTVALAGFLITA